MLGPPAAEYGRGATQFKAPRAARWTIRLTLGDAVAVQRFDRRRSTRVPLLPGVDAAETRTFTVSRDDEELRSRSLPLRLEEVERDGYQGGDACVESNVVL